MTGAMALRRRPVGVAVTRVTAMAAAALVVATAHGVHDPGILCPLRLLTGIPCPFCGGTTVFIELGSGHPVRALLANPLVFVGAIVFAVAPLGVEARWRTVSPRARAWLFGTAIAGSGVWQSFRCGVL
ncbi:DUF2752 domain-containing protein [Actinocorallia sp. A-T 12471]|uniref:DUF2752 domain-containing protein n=1 Tax=Actinocorallia sp. A-T 12471 TaxID=3089813 RepID=UPI0029CBFC46|nr:DUF2752 domain-containing protein [Actinocorallia sp. A-T 12471]MDX6742549.1 DUF2752 domain-containing protein [Actinocorallia sp. A-T 12471]